jgi:hypothetical protein
MQFFNIMDSEVLTSTNMETIFKKIEFDWIFPQIVSKFVLVKPLLYRAPPTFAFLGFMYSLTIYDNDNYRCFL